MLTSIAVLLLGIWVILNSQEPVSETLSLVIGVVVVVLAAIELLPALGARYGRRVE